MGEDGTADRAREAARDEQIYRLLYDASPDPLLTVDATGRVLGCNGTALDWLGAPVERLVGRPLSDLFEPADAEIVLRLARSGWLGVSERRFTLTSGHVVSLAAAPSPTKTESGYHVTLHDVTTRALLDEADAERRRLLALTQFAGGVARELNDPMSIVQGRLELLLEVCRDEALARHVRIALEHARRISATLRNLRLVGHNTVPRLERVFLCDALEEAIELVGTRLRDFRLEVHIEPPELAVGGEPATLARVLANVLQRVIESANGPRLEIRARRRGDEVHVDVLGGAASTTELAAVPSGRVDATFETGLGLSVASTLVQSIGGRMEQRSAAGSTWFAIALPRAPAVRVRARPVEGRLLVVGAKELANAVVSLLAGDGYDVRWSRDAETALQLVDAVETPVFGVISELLLPGTSGLALADELARRGAPASERFVLVGEQRTATLPSQVTALRMPLSREALLDALDLRAPRRRPR